MKERFLPKRFEPKSLTLIETINGILDEYVREGYDLSLRQLYYQLVSRAIIENNERSYKNIGNLVSDARLAGLIDWDVIKDRGREMIQNTHWTTPREILQACSEQYRVDRWLTQPCYVEVMVEKQALEGVLLPVCRNLDVPFTANKGYSSSSALYEAGQRLARASANDKDVHVIYLGDHDPSGVDMTRDVDDRLNLLSRLKETVDVDGRSVTVERIALNMDQVKKYNPPPNPAKLTDRRAGAYIKRFGKSSWELDAIEPKRLANLVTKAIEKHIDWTEWEKSTKEIDVGRAYIKKVAESYKPKK